MASLKILVSSTCYDLSVVRSKLQSFITSIGYDPVLSEYSDILFDPRTHTHESCLAEVANCDMMILIIGSRFGGTVIPKAKSMLDPTIISTIEERHSGTDLDISITQAEAIKAIELNRPIFAFVDSKVLHDHLVYEKNKSKEFLTSINFPSIEKPETAHYIFEFINYLRLKSSGNSITPFASIEDIEIHLKKQWSGLFQRLLTEDRTRSVEAERSRSIQEQLNDLKAAILSSIETPKARQIANGVIQFRQIIEFILSLKLNSPTDLIKSDDFSWKGLMNEAGIDQIACFTELPTNHKYFNTSFFLIGNESYFQYRGPISNVTRLEEQCTKFAQLSADVRSPIFDALRESITYFYTTTRVNKPFSSVCFDIKDPTIVEYYNPLNLFGLPLSEALNGNEIESEKGSGA